MSHFPHQHYSIPTLVREREEMRGYQRDLYEKQPSIQFDFTQCLREESNKLCGSSSYNFFFSVLLSAVYYWDKRCTSEYWCGWQLSNKAADKTDPFIRRRVSLPFSSRDKTVRTQWMQAAAFSPKCCARLPVQMDPFWRGFQTIIIITGDIQQTPSGHTPDCLSTRATISIYMKSFVQTAQSFDQIWPRVGGFVWAKWK